MDVSMPQIRIGFQLNNRRRYPWIFLILSIALLVVIYLLGGETLKDQLAIPVAGVAVAFGTFIFTQQLQETRLFADLFREFNARYDELNKPLNRIVETADSGIHGDDRQTLMHYFNLCAEEYLYYKAGYIDESVWTAWARGMMFYADVPGIRRIWENEIQGGSYYGFSLSVLVR
jgi:hypothetical protein